MTQLLPLVSRRNVQTLRKVLQPALKRGLGVVFGLACLLMLMPGTSQAKGGGGRSRGGSSFTQRSGNSTRTSRQNVVHQHKHKHKNAQGIEVDGDAASADAGQAQAQDASAAAQAEEAAAVVYGMEITTLHKGAAAKGGLEIGDIIMSVNGTSTPTFEALAQAIAQAGNRAQVLVVREDGGERETVTLYPQSGYIGVSVEPARVE